MLAQSFKTAVELKLTDAQHSALIKTLALLDNGKLRHVPDTKLSRYGAPQLPCHGQTALGLGALTLRQLP